MTKSTNGNRGNDSRQRRVAAALGIFVVLVGAGVWLNRYYERKRLPANDSFASPTNIDNGSGSTAKVGVASAPAGNGSTNDAAPAVDAGSKPGSSGDKVASKSETPLEEARHLIEQKEFDQAIERLDDAIKADAQSAIAYLLRGHAYERQGKPGEALEDFNRAEELANTQTNLAGGVNLGELWEWRGELYLQQTNAAAAIEDFSRAIARHSERVATESDSTNALQTVEPLQNAADPTSTNAIANTDTNRIVDLPYVMRGYAYLIAGQPTNALPDLHYWIERHGDDPLGYFYRGQVRVALEQPDAALADFSRTIELDTNYIGAWEFRGDVHYRKGDYQAALDDFLAALKLSDKSEYAARMGGWSAFKLGRLPLTIELLSRSLKLNPTNAIVYENRGSAYAQLEQWSKALADYTSAAQYEPNAGRLQFYRANFQICLGDMDAALSIAEEALRCPDLDPQQRLYLIILTALGKPADTAAQQRLKDEVLPENANWPAPIVQFLRGDINYARAVAAAHDKGQLDELHTYTGWHELITGRTQDGRAHLQQMIREGDRRLFEYHLALLLLKPAETAVNSDVTP